MSQAEQKKEKLLKWLIHEGHQYSNSQRTYSHGVHTFYSEGEVRLAKIIDRLAGDYQYETHVSYAGLRDGDRVYEFCPDIVTDEPYKVVGCSYNITVFEYFGGSFLTHDDIRKMQALRAATGKRGHIFLPGHLPVLENEDAVWHERDFIDFRSPGRAENFDEVSFLLMIDVLRQSGIDFYTNPEFHGCIAQKNDRKFAARGHIFVPYPIKVIGVDEPIQYMRFVKKLTKAEIISIEALHATRNINGYAFLPELVRMYARQGLFKKRPSMPDKVGQFYAAHTNESQKLREQIIKRPGNGGRH